MLGANWRTTVLGFSSAFMALLTLLAAAPYELGEVAAFIPAEYKAKLFLIGAIATFILRVIKSTQEKDKQVHGGPVQNDVKP